jgi:excisionase family DNA binding protein
LDPEYLTIPEADYYVGLSGDTLFELIESGKLPAIDVGPRPGGKYRILRADLERLKE